MTWLILLGGFAAGALGGLGLAVVEFGAWFLVSPRRPPAPKPGPPPLPSSAEPIRVRARDGVELAGWWLAAPRPTGKTMILVHGFIDGPEAMIADRGSAILDRGWNVAAMSLRAHGPSGGAVSSLGAREAADLGVWLDAMADRCPSTEPFVPVVWGRSMGAAIALRAAVDDPRIRALVLEAPLVDLESVVAASLRKRWIPLASFFARLILRRAQRLAGASPHRPRPLDLARRVTIPVIVIHGEADALVPSASARALAESFAHPAPFVEVPGAGHTDLASLGGSFMFQHVFEMANHLQ